MAKPPSPRFDLVVREQSFSFTAAALEGFPEARGFIEYLLSKGRLQLHVIVDYVKLAARLKRQGRIDDPELITQRVEATAANAYQKWRAESYTIVLQPVRRALKTVGPKELTWLRRHSLVPAFEGKIVPRKCITTVPQFRTWYEWDSCTSWTLHVPTEPQPAHQDPCESCRVIVLDDETVAVIAEAFEKVWGHRDLNAVPPEALLFGAQPRDMSDALTTEIKSQQVVACTELSTVSQALATVGVRAKITRDVDSFLARLKEGADGVYLSRETCGDRLQEVLTALLTAWHSNGTTP